MSEIEIIEGCKQGIACAFEAFYKRYGWRMKIICMKYSKNTFEAEDLFHESLLKVFNKIKSYQFQGSFEGWLNALTTRIAIDYCHQEKNQLIIYNDREVQEIEIQQEDQETKFDRIANYFSEETIIKIIDTLPSGYKTIFNMYTVENYSHKEIAEVLKIAEGTSKSQLSKARKMLKKLIGQELKSMEREWAVIINQ